MTIATTRAGDGTIAYETFGDPADPPVVLIMGLGVQMLGWDDAFCAMLADRGHRVVRFDNRDVGESTHLTDGPQPDLRAVMAGDGSSAPYRLRDMARDTVGLLDALDLPAAHLVGASMGGMIAQTAAIEHPGRVASLTSIMSTTGDPTVGRPQPEAFAVLLQPPTPDRDTAAEQAVRAFRVIGSPGFPLDEERVRDRAARSYDRAYDPQGVARQLAAILASGDRTPDLRGLDVPTLVIHGDADPLVTPSGGRATAEAVPGAELTMVAGMGHDLPEPVWEQVLDAIATHVAEAERRRAERV